MLSLLDRAGATVTGQIQLTNDFSDPARAEELRSLAATTLPTGATLPEVPQAGAIAGGLLGSVLIAPAGGNAVASPEQAAAVLSALTSAGFITVTGTPVAGQSVVILTGAESTGGSEADKAATVADLAGQLAQNPDVTGLVLAGHIRLGKVHRFGRRRPRRHRTERDCQHGGQRGLGHRSHRHRARPRRAERRRSRTVRLRSGRPGAGADPRGRLATREPVTPSDPRR